MCVADAVTPKAEVSSLEVGVFHWKGNGWLFFGRSQLCIPGAVRSEKGPQRGHYTLELGLHH